MRGFRPGHRGSLRKVFRIPPRLGPGNPLGRLLFLLVVVAVLYGGLGRVRDNPDVRSSFPSESLEVGRAYEERESGVTVTGEGVVVEVLPDDLEGSRHQRFVLRLPSGQTLLIAHNIDIAPRLPSLEPGESVAFYGEYEWNSRGGLVHWTHRDPDGRGRGGWLKYRGKTFR